MGYYNLQVLGIYFKTFIYIIAFLYVCWTELILVEPNQVRLSVKMVGPEIN